MLSSIYIHLSVQDQILAQEIGKRKSTNYSSSQKSRMLTAVLKSVIKWRLLIIVVAVVI